MWSCWIFPGGNPAFNQAVACSLLSKTRPGNQMRASAIVFAPASYTPEHEENHWGSIAGSRRAGWSAGRDMGKDRGSPCRRTRAARPRLKRPMSATILGLSSSLGRWDGS